jgi:hypothetical protein
VVEGEAGRERLLRHAALAVGQHIATSPKAARKANGGIGRNAGRWSARPSAFENCRFVHAPARPALTGPRARSIRRVQHERAQILHVDPGHPVLAGADRTTEAELEGA